MLLPHMSPNGYNRITLLTDYERTCNLGYNMAFLIKAIKSGKEAIGMPGQERGIFTRKFGIGKIEYIDIFEI